LKSGSKQRTTWSGDCRTKKRSNLNSGRRLGWSTWLISSRPLTKTSSRPAFIWSQWPDVIAIGRKTSYRHCRAGGYPVVATAPPGPVDSADWRLDKSDYAPNIGFAYHFFLYKIWACLSRQKPSVPIPIKTIGKCLPKRR